MAAAMTALLACAIGADAAHLSELRFGVLDGGHVLALAGYEAPAGGNPLAQMPAPRAPGTVWVIPIVGMHLPGEAVVKSYWADLARRSAGPLRPLCRRRRAPSRSRLRTWLASRRRSSAGALAPGSSGCFGETAVGAR